MWIKLVYACQPVSIIRLVAMENENDWVGFNVSVQLMSIYIWLHQMLKSLEMIEFLQILKCTYLCNAQEPEDIFNYKNNFVFDASSAE